MFHKTLLIQCDYTLMPRKIKVGDWIDLCAAENITLNCGENKLIPLGVAIKLPKGYEAHILPRSSTFKHWGILLVNSMGIIDNSYCGPDDMWGFHALAVRDTSIEKGDRICQFRIVRKQPKLNIKHVHKLKGKNRGGFGSTGIK